MKSGPTFAAAGRCPARRNAATSPVATVVFPTPERVPAITTRGPNTLPASTAADPTGRWPGRRSGHAVPLRRRRPCHAVALRRCHAVPRRRRCPMSYPTWVRKTSVYLPDHLKRALAARAAGTGRSEAEVLRAAVEAEVAAGHSPVGDAGASPTI